MCNERQSEKTRQSSTRDNHVVDIPRNSSRAFARVEITQRTTAVTNHAVLIFSKARFERTLFATPRRPQKLALANIQLSAAPATCRTV
jgi:hypothetical protein